MCVLYITCHPRHHTPVEPGEHCNKHICACAVKCIRTHTIVYLHPRASQIWFAKSFYFSEILNVGMADKDCGSITQYSKTEMNLPSNLHRTTLVSES